ncbi:visual pigment-like receptor peropsin [Ruditapes philippinarum]|uniref:visual pigment-like receptor peropsin n=1 Tax=Ruditapes philippinarum TaxID=129788 RepID=UPI00295BC9EC|nr:visual pigment-like receptor peropsin [Ruditapes philippinarum]
MANVMGSITPISVKVESLTVRPIDNRNVLKQFIDNEIIRTKLSEQTDIFTGPNDIVWLDTRAGIYSSESDFANNFTATCCGNLEQNVATPFHQVPDFLYIIYSVYISLILVLGLSQNSITLYVFVKEKCLRRSHNIFIVGLALGDVCMCLSSTWMVIVSSAHHRWIFGYSGCVYYGFTTTLLGITQISLLATIALDRYLVIVRPSHFTIGMSKAVTMVICCYGYGFLWALFPAVGWSSYQLEGIRLRCAINWRSKRPLDLSYSLSILVLAWVVPLGIILFCYGAICTLIYREREKPLRASMRKGKTGKHRRREQRVAITVLLMIGAFFLSWTPYSIVTIIVIFGKLEDVPVSVIMIPTLMAKSSIIWNPLIYVVRHNDFRKACLRHVPCITWIKNAFVATSMSSNSSSYTV